MITQFNGACMRQQASVRKNVDFPLTVWWANIETNWHKDCCHCGGNIWIPCQGQVATLRYCFMSSSIRQTPSVHFANIDSLSLYTAKHLYPEFMWDIITHPCLDFNSGLTKPSLKIGHGWVISSHCFTWMWLLIHAQIAMLVYLILVNERGPVNYLHIIHGDNSTVSNKGEKAHDDVIKW